MKFDRWTNWVLAVIAVCLGIIALRPMITPKPVEAQSTGLAGVQFNGSWPSGSAGFFVFDTRSGDVWFDSHPQMGGQAEHWGKLTKLGQPLAK